MDFVGRQPTEAELLDMTSPYGTNHGEQWTAESISKYVRIGAEAASQDAAVAAELAKGLVSLRVVKDGERG